jgi:hypothetical protein
MDGIALFESIKRVATLQELMNYITGRTKAETQSKRGNVFEKVWDLVIKFGFCPDLQNDTYDHYVGNVNTCKLKKVDNLELYLRHLAVFSKGHGGSSDITLQHKTTGKWVMISSKFYMDDRRKSIDKYDVAQILAVVKLHAYKYKECDIIIVVNNKQKVLNTIRKSQATSNYITDNISRILDMADLEVYFHQMRSAIQGMAFTDVNANFCTANVPLVLRFHQDLTTHKQMGCIAQQQKELLLGAKARSGKTYCVGGLFIKYHRKYGVLNGLIITPAPTETLSQFTDDLFHKFRDFNGINITEIKKSTDFATMAMREHNIVIVSKQLLDEYVLDKTIGAIKNLNLDFIVFDENHFHGTTTMARNIITSYASPKTVKLYLTATYAKPLSAWNVPTDCQCYWDIEDEQLCKRRDIKGLVDKHGTDVCLFVSVQTADQVLGVYDSMPDLHILTNMMDKQRFDIIKAQIKDTSYGFSNKTLLSGNFPNEVDIMLRYITGSNKEHDYPAKDLSIFGRIKRIAIDHNSRTRLNSGDFTSQLWFLPFGKNMTIDNVSEHLKDRMEKNSILQHYEIKIVNSKKEYNLKDIKDEIRQWELKAKHDGKSGLILLAGNQLTLGITLPMVDVVLLFNDIMSSDKIMQMMYRCMTERICGNDTAALNTGLKKIGFVVDLNISRVLNTCLDYNVYAKDLNIEQKLSYLVETNLINIDSDLFQGRDNKTNLVQMLLNIWKADPINNLKILLRKIEETIVDMDTHDQKLLNRYFTRATAGDRVNIKVQFDEDNEDALPTGTEITKQAGGDIVATDAESAIADVASTDISLTKDVLPFVIPLICILTMNTDHSDILEMLNAIKTDPALLNVFRDQSFIWWNKPDIIRLIEAIVAKYIIKSSDIYNISLQFKMSLQSLIDTPKELLELIDSCLKPKQKEKQENGEVFTPMCLVFEMLDKLDAHYIADHGRSIFAEPRFKWFDPAAGMGNFPVAVYLRLMTGLKAHLPDDSERKKHIIENMLYMSELNKKNVFISHQIFNMDNRYRLNIHEGDTLELDISRVWNMGNHSFDVILGNPPYNKGGIRSHTGKQLGARNETIWPKFIEKSFDWLKPDGFLVFINPLSWLKKSHSMHNAMLTKYIVWLTLWNNSHAQKMINGCIPISLYVLQNTLNATQKKTEITSILKRQGVSATATEYLNPEYSIPLAFHSIFNKLAEFIKTHDCRLEYNIKTVKSSGTKEQIPAEYVLDDMWAVDTFTIRDGLMVKKTTVHHPDANKRKLIIANKTSFAGAFIDNGRLALTGNDKSYITGDNLELLLKMLSFKISDMICHSTKYRQDFLEKEVYTYLPDIRKVGIVDITEDEFYMLIGLTPLEICQIKNPRLNTTAVDASAADVLSPMAATGKDATE